MIFELCGWHKQVVEVGSVKGLKKLVGVEKNAIVTKTGEPRILAKYGSKAEAEKVFADVIKAIEEGVETYHLPKEMSDND